MVRNWVPEGRLPMKPLQEWLERRLAVYEADPRVGHAMLQLAKDLKWSEKQVRRYRAGVRDTSVMVNGKRVHQTLPAEDFPLVTVEEGLFHAGVFLWEVYPEHVLPGVPEFNGTGWCPKCKEVSVRDTRKRCLWCGVKTQEVAA